MLVCPKKKRNGSLDAVPQAASHTPDSYPCGTTPPLAAFRKGAKSRLAAVTNLKISPPAPVPILYHCRPHPHILPLAPPPRLPMSPHLVKRNHRRRLGARYAPSALCAPPAHPGQRGGPPF